MKGWLLLACACGVAETGVLLCPPGTTSTIDGCAPVGLDGGTDGFVRVEGDLHFGALAVGGVRTRLLVIRNGAPFTAFVQLGAFDGSPAFRIDGPPRLVQLEPGGRLELTVTYQPRGGPDRAILEVGQCDQPACKTIVVEASGIGVIRALACFDTDFGAVDAGRCAFQSVVCTNDTDYAFTFLRAGSMGSPAFLIDLPRPDTRVDPRQSILFEAAFCPFADGFHASTVEMISDVTPNLSSSTFELRGETVIGDSFLECPRDLVTLSAPVGGIAETFVECSSRGTTVIEALRFPPVTTPELSAELFIDGIPVSLPAVVREGTVIEVRIVFAPFQEGQHNVPLLIDYGDGQTDSIRIVAETDTGFGCELTTPTAIDFGRVPVGTVASEFAPIINTGTGACTISTQIFADPGMSLLFPPVGGIITLNPGDEIQAQAQFAPVAIGTYTATAVLDVAELGIPIPILLLGRGIAAAACGNTTVDPGEQCDDGNVINTDACIACSSAGCLDGFLQWNAEACDDGNNNPNDACSNTCGWNQPGYFVSTIPSALVPSIGLPLPFPNPDDSAAEIPIGFPFTFAGTPATSAYVSTNGLIAFRPDGAGTFVSEAIPSNRDPSWFVAWWWTDLHVAQPGVMTISTSTITGVAPNRVHRFTFVDVTGFSTNTPVISAEVRLFETTNVVEVHYGAIVVRSPNDFAASAGFESLTGLYGQDVLGCSPSCSSIQWPSDTLFRYVPTF